jgi:two-component system chemotaxis response regulator CheB
MNQIIKVLIVDDSAYARNIIERILIISPFIEVIGKARNGKNALDMVEKLKPDVVLLDLLMPVMDGITFIKEQMKRHPIRIIIVSIVSEKGKLIIDALNAGAIDFIQKPTALTTRECLELRDDLIQKIKTAAVAELKHLNNIYDQTSQQNKVTEIVTSKGKFDVIIIGISTGGPQALRYLIPQFPANFPVPIVIVLHMPEGYTKMYSDNLNEISDIQVKEAKEGDPLLPGTVTIAAAGFHLTFNKNAQNHVAFHLDRQPEDTLHRPSVDIVFNSAAEMFKERVLGIIMTGMGSDGKEGAAWIKANGGIVLTESKETCVIYGMPRSVDEIGLSDQSVPLYGMAEVIKDLMNE